MPPLISVIMPCYNSVNTLPWAISSLIAQTYYHWECILVDDCSTDSTRDLVTGVIDPRIKYYRMAPNQGSGAARNFALSMAHGDYIAFLDSDDWIYPDKLMRQLEVLSNTTGLTLVSAGMAIVDSGNDLLGIRGRPDPSHSIIQQPLIRIRDLNIPFGPSMCDGSAARGCDFDPNLSHSEDYDFLYRLLRNHNYLVLPEVFYAYREFNMLDYNKIALKCEGVRNRLRKCVADRPLESRVLTLTNYFKQISYKVAFKAGYGYKLVERRNTPPIPSETYRFLEARTVVEAVVKRVFG